MKRINSFLLGVIIAFTTGLVRQDEASPGFLIQPPADPVPITLFGLHIHRAASSTPWPTSPFGSWRLWDAHVAWPDLEPEPGRWDFAALDKYVSLAEKNGVEILLPLGLSPLWATARPSEKSAYGPGNAAEPKRLDDWRNYVRTVATRYKGRIKQYEIWNEPNLKDFFSGSPRQMIALVRVAHDALHEVDPSITLVSPSPTGVDGIDWLDEFLQKGGGTYVDVIGYHFYVSPGPPEAMLSMIGSVREVMARHDIPTIPLWNTESGWRIENQESVVKPQKGTWSKVLSKTEASAYIARSYILDWTAGVSRLYWYAWDNGTMGLTEADGKELKPPAGAYAEVGKWLVGSRVISCTLDSHGTWVAELDRNDGNRAWIIWNGERAIDFNIPESWGVQGMRDLGGGLRRIEDSLKIRIDQVPVMLERPPSPSTARASFATIFGSQEYETFEAKVR